ncbi:MAG: DUF924 domain-containing protein [Betaproteobacteria bacterium]|nr:DUF924 domain-containing protein [Betaproteobacteria bacterium]
MLDPDSLPATARAVLEFWFGTGDDYGRAHAKWFRKEAAFDGEIRTRFLDAVERAARGDFRDWERLPRGCLALQILLDQFPRNLFRGEARAFAADAEALRICRHVMQHGFDRDFLPVERMFVYLPLEHSESLADQDECHRRMLDLQPYPETADLHIWAEKHRVIIRRFGRFPHRNAALGRPSTPEEIAFLETPGSSF